MTDNFQLIVSEANLGEAEVADLVAQFSEYQAIAAEWKEKADRIVVTDPSQTTEMKMARTGRLFLKEKRVSIEKTRKALKESSLRKGKAIDALAKYLTSLIQPIEEHLDRQEHFVEIREKEEADRKRKEVEARMEAERIEREKKEAEERAAKEQADREERRRLQEENERLRKDNEEKDRIAREERERAEAEKRRIEQEKKDAEDKARAERAAAVKREADLKAQIETKVAGPADVICPACGCTFKAMVWERARGEGE